MLFKTIENQIEKLDTNSISSERQNVLQPLVHFIQSKVETNAVVRLNFICTHNSRRSHLSQVWAQTMAHYFDIKMCFVILEEQKQQHFFQLLPKTLESTGFEIETIANGVNPIYAIKYSENEHPILGFSKKFDSNFNPNSNFELF